MLSMALSQGYTDETVLGGGALKGKNCVVSNIEEVADGVNVTFQWTLDNGTVQTDTAFIPRGTQGETGVDGKSAYEIWLEAGNTGTEEDFLISLVGEKGADGTMTFEDLTDEQKASLKGEDGKSAYDIWLDDGNTGTEEEFLESLKGDGADITVDDTLNVDSTNPIQNKAVAENILELLEELAKKSEIDDENLFSDSTTLSSSKIRNLIYSSSPIYHRLNQFGESYSEQPHTIDEVFQKLKDGEIAMIPVDNFPLENREQFFTLYGGCFILYRLYPTKAVGLLYSMYTGEYYIAKWEYNRDLDTILFVEWLPQGVGNNEELENYLKVIESTIGYTCKNLIPLPYGTSPSESRGITFTPNTDGTVSYSGIANDPTASFYTYPTVMYLPAGSYKITGGDDIYGGAGLLLYDDASCSTVYTGGHEGLLTISTTSVYVYNTQDGTVNWNKDTNPYGYEKEFTIDKPAYAKIQARSANNTYTEEVNGTIYPMVRLASIEDDTWEAYQPNVDERLKNLLAGKEVKAINNQFGSTTKLYRITDAPTESGKGYTVKLVAQRKNATAHIEYLSVSRVNDTYTFESNIEMQEKNGSTGELTTMENSNFLIVDANYEVWAHIPSYTYAYVELISPNTRGTFEIDGAEGTPAEAYLFSMYDKRVEDGAIPVVESGEITHHTITKNKDITDLPISTDRSGNKIYSTDELYLTYEFEELVDAFEQWFVDKGITPERGMTYDDIEQLSFYIPAGGGYGYVNTYFKFDNTTYMVYCLKYQDVEYILLQMTYDHTNKEINRNYRYGLNVINFGKIIPDLAGSSVKSDILEVLHNWFQVYKPIGLDNAKGVPLTPGYDKQCATLSQDELVSVAYGNNQGSYDLGNGVSLMTSPLQRLLFTLNKDGTELRAFANGEGKATAALSAGFFDGGNLLQAKNTFEVLEDMSSPPIPTLGTFGVYTVTPNATGQPESLTKGGTLITAYITGSLYSQSVNYIGTRIAIFFTEGAMYYTLGLGGKYYPTSSWTSPIKWNKITTTLV